MAEALEVNFHYPPGATPLSPDDLEGLIPGHISTQGDLDAWEQQNILEARQKLARRKPQELLTDDALRRIHRYMFDQTWQWAGRYRNSNKNIGVAWERVPEQIRILCDDTRYQRDHGTYPVDEFGQIFAPAKSALPPSLAVAHACITGWLPFILSRMAMVDTHVW